ncbi:MAG: hypothetical protein RLZZ561_1721 [Pseudomonadota bacterium]
MNRPVILTRLWALSLMLGASTSLGAQALVTGDAAKPLDPAAQLSENLKALARDPFNVDALLLAGGGALAVGDPNAAFGFYARAEELSPENYQAKVGLGSALTLMEKPGEALRAFDEAIRLGAPEADLLADRGLAYDLAGDPKKAQRDYLAALKTRPSDEVTRRLALSLGVAGERDAALVKLEPLIKQNDQGAWRARAFILAMNGDAAGAEKIVRMVAPADVAQSLTGFMQRLPALTTGAKAAAVHFGTLPASGQSPQMASLEDEFRPVNHSAVASLTAADPERKIAAATAPDPRQSRRQAREAKVNDKVGPTASLPPRSPQIARQKDGGDVTVTMPDTSDRLGNAAAVQEPLPFPTSPAPAPSGARPGPLFEVPAARPKQSMAAVMGPPASVPLMTAPAPSSADPMPAPPVSAQQAPAVQREVAVAQAPPVARSLADLVRTLELEEESAPVALPDAEKLRVMRIAAQRKAAAEEKARAEKAAEERRIAEEAAKARRNPARIWVQIATGRNTDALPRTWRQIRDDAPKALDGQRAWYVSFRQTNRLLVGPVRSSSAARELVNDLAREGVQATIFSSEAGQEIERLSGK